MSSVYTNGHLYKLQTYVFSLANGNLYKLQTYVFNLYKWPFV